MTRLEDTGSVPGNAEFEGCGLQVRRRAGCVPGHVGEELEAPDLSLNTAATRRLDRFAGRVLPSASMIWPLMLPQHLSNSEQTFLTFEVANTMLHELAHACEITLVKMTILTDEVQNTMNDIRSRWRVQHRRQRAVLLPACREPAGLLQIRPTRREARQLPKSPLRRAHVNARARRRVNARHPTPFFDPATTARPPVIGNYLGKSVPWG